MTHKVTIPVVQVERKLLQTLFDSRDLVQNVTVPITADENPWIGGSLFPNICHFFKNSSCPSVRCFDTIAFLLIMQVGLAMINSFGVIIALDATVSHLFRLFFEKNFAACSKIRNTILIMAAGSFMEFSSCLIRLVYCSIGPVYATTTISFPSHIFLIYSNLLIDTLTTLVAVSLFLRWGAFGKGSTWFKRHLEHFLAALGILIIVLVFWSGYIEVCVLNLIRSIIFALTCQSFSGPLHVRGVQDCQCCLAHSCFPASISMCFEFFGCGVSFY